MRRSATGAFHENVAVPTHRNRPVRANGPTRGSPVTPDRGLRRSDVYVVVCFLIGLAFVLPRATWPSAPVDPLREPTKHGRVSRAIQPSSDSRTAGRPNHSGTRTSSSALRDHGRNLGRTVARPRLREVGDAEAAEAARGGAAEAPPVVIGSSAPAPTRPGSAIPRCPATPSACRRRASGCRPPPRPAGSPVGRWGGGGWSGWDRTGLTAVARRRAAVNRREAGLRRRFREPAGPRFPSHCRWMSESRRRRPGTCFAPSFVRRSRRRPSPRSCDTP